MFACKGLWSMSVYKRHCGGTVSIVTDTGGALVTDTGGALVTDTGEALVADTGRA